MDDANAIISTRPKACQSLFQREFTTIGDETHTVRLYNVLPGTTSETSSPGASSSGEIYQPALDEYGKSIEEPSDSSSAEDVLEFETQFDYEERGAFTPYRIHGFDNTGIPGGEYIAKNLSCSSLAHSAQVGVQESFFLHDNLMEIAADLDKHPMVNYRPTVGRIGEDKFPLSQIVDMSWDRLATACVFMQDYGVYLCVSRVMYHPNGKNENCLISFLRGQIFSESWIHLDRYRLKWQDQEIVFPKIFDTKTEYDIAGALYGPEDARIIIEEGVQGAEPVVVFNMISTQSDWKRAIWVFRPFSQRSRILTIRGQEERAQTEKNWAPFFVRESDEDDSMTATRQPSQHIHFIWRFQPLTVLKCHLISGMCDIVYEQTTTPELLSYHEDHDASLRGGTQLVPIPLSHKHSTSFGAAGVQAFAAFPRTHIENAGGCGMAVYRPELGVIVTNTTHFYLSYGSKAVDFGPNMVMDGPTVTDVCTAGRIMITNSIARWDMNAHDNRGAQTDIMTLTLSVDDSTVQVLRLSGVWDLLRTLPSLAGYFGQSGPGAAGASQIEEFPAIEKVADDWLDARVRVVDPFERANAVGWDIRACLEESALEYVRVNSDKHNQNQDQRNREKEEERNKIIEEEETRKKAEKDEAARRREEERAQRNAAKAKELAELKKAASMQTEQEEEELELKKEAAAVAAAKAAKEGKAAMVDKEALPKYGEKRPEFDDVESQLEKDDVVDAWEYGHP
ncbi:Beta-mannosyltransferase 1 [Exophiala oligosperma]